MITKEMQARLIAHFLWTSTAYRAARRSASRPRSRAVAVSDQLESDGSRSPAGRGGVGRVRSRPLAGLCRLALRPP